MRVLLTLIACALIGTPVRSAPSEKRGSRLVFHGWSADSRLVAYTRYRIGRTRPDQRMHRFVAGGAFAGFGKKVGGDVEGYARERGYVLRAAPARRIDEAHFELEAGGARLDLTLVVGRAQSWRLERAGVLLAEHAFDRIYLAWEVELYVAPDGSQAVMVMHLDTGWEIDAAIFPVSLTGYRR